MPVPPLKQLFTLHEVAVATTFAISTLYRYAALDLIKLVRIGSRTFMTAEELDRLVTGQIDLDTLPIIASLRRRFDRVIVVSMVERPTRIPVHPGLTIIEARTADEVAHRWNTGVAR